jgi:hypothetical protein
MLMDGRAEAARLDAVIELLAVGVEKLTSPQALQEVRGAIAQRRGTRERSRQRRRRRR